RWAGAGVSLRSSFPPAATIITWGSTPGPPDHRWRPTRTHDCSSGSWSFPMRAPSKTQPRASSAPAPRWLAPATGFSPPTRGGSTFAWWRRAEPRAAPAMQPERGLARRGEDGMKQSAGRRGLERGLAARETVLPALLALALLA